MRLFYIKPKSLHLYGIIDIENSLYNVNLLTIKTPPALNEAGKSNLFKYPLRLDLYFPVFGLSEVIMHLAYRK